MKDPKMQKAVEEWKPKPNVHAKDILKGDNFSPIWHVMNSDDSFHYTHVQRITSQLSLK